MFRWVVEIGNGSELHEPCAVKFIAVDTGVTHWSRTIVNDRALDSQHTHVLWWTVCETVLIAHSYKHPHKYCLSFPVDLASALDSSPPGNQRISFLLSRRLRTPGQWEGSFPYVNHCQANPHCCWPRFLSANPAVAIFGLVYPPLLSIIRPLSASFNNPPLFTIIQPLSTLIRHCSPKSGHCLR